MLKYFRFVRDAINDPFYPEPAYLAPFWVLRNWRWLCETYAELDAS